MENLFSDEKRVVLKAEELLASGMINAQVSTENYKELLKGYKKLLRQSMKLLKMADLMQLELKNVKERLETITNIDVLTGLFNRRFFNLNYIREWSSAIRTNSSLACIMIDIDFFKKYNDTYGHLQGDECLKAVANAITAAVKRPRDIVARFGGEEFVVLLPETKEDGAFHIANEILRAVNRMEMQHDTSDKGGMVTVSMGVAELIPSRENAGEILLNMADEALYRAKNDGRNCIRRFGK